jgi:hypothetical protein
LRPGILATDFDWKPQTPLCHPERSREIRSSADHSWKSLRCTVMPVSQPSQPFAKVNAAVCHLESDCLMCLNRLFLVDPGIRRHLLAPVLSRPRFCGAHQAFTHPSMSKSFLHQPAFDKPHWVRYITAIRMRSQSDLQKSDQRPITILCNQDGSWKSSVHA